jgi:hypothetical protein
MGRAEAGGKEAQPANLPLLVSCLIYSCTLKMEVIYSSKTLGFRHTTWCYNPDHILMLHTKFCVISHSCEK